MLWLHLVMWATGALMHGLGKLTGSNASLAAATFLLGPLSLLLCLFNCLNVGFSIGLNMLYVRQLQ